MRLRLVLGFLAALGSGKAIAASCPTLDRYQPNAAGESPYRPLPVLAPDRAGGGGTLTLDIHLLRFGGPKDAGRTLRIGSYNVADVPVFVIAPRAGTKAMLVDADGASPVPLSTECLQDPRWIFGGTLWQLIQSDQLRVTLQSDLDYDAQSGAGAIHLPKNGSVPCRATNLHTHGFLVPPAQPASPDGLYGDFPLDVTQPAGSAGGPRDDCGDPLGHSGHRVLSTPIHYGITIPGRPHQNGLETGQHPSGLFWYHPHPHGFSRMQTGGGTTGLITIGDLADYACRENTRGGKCPPRGAPSQIRYFELKDAQLSSKPANGVYNLLADYSSGACGTRKPGEARRGECAFDDKTGIWVFTVNGVEYPIMNPPKPDEEEVWRIANASPNATYLLELADAKNRSSLKPFRILALDGVSVAESSGAPARETTRILLMPGSRAELWVTPEPGRTFVLKTAEINTGNNGFGDDWPDVDLAEIRWPEPEVILRGPALAVPGIHVTGPEDKSLPADAAAKLLEAGKKKTAGPAPACRLDPGDQRHIYLVRRGDPREIFGLLAGIRRANGRLEFFDESGQVVANSLQAAWKRVGSGAPVPSPAFGSNPLSNICAVQGRIETWVVENWTGECHNFHIHQSRFRLDTAPGHLGSADYFAYPRTPTQNAPVDLMDGMIRDLTESPGGGRPLTVWRNAYHDSVPVPRGESKCAANPASAQCGNVKPADSECQGDPGGALCNPGRISIVIGFQRQEQVGTFIYHCHILEHEDGGMMGELRVCAANDAGCLGGQAAHH